ncbi:MAG: division/cell wall cluster transcriptional repressor MraZ [Calditrichaceae bacterium]|nr:division/cell wall cluster transcriptional repressor MraZ [Calditrichia bacterium]NUQ40175.1 division/cell wall cluster transcriptional repressor MraZ [Calditrichaceae bacterium]
MNGFWGSVNSTLDNKGRINFPARFRRNLQPEDEDTLMLVRGTHPCISVYPLTSWRYLIEDIRRKVQTEREFGLISRRLMYQAGEQKIDKQGRLNLSADLIEYANLDSEILIVGYQNKLEIWNPDKYQQFVEATETDYQNIVRDLDI